MIGNECQSQSSLSLLSLAYSYSLPLALGIAGQTNEPAGRRTGRLGKPLEHFSILSYSKELSRQSTPAFPTTAKGLGAKEVLLGVPIRKAASLYL